ncbi:MAG: helix-turn-helix transcriptional regulator [Verrucomicrobia bacterium]|nr:helix-turn-helix transcriptional regulator [Verrucomicrobiota bacterium]
MTPVHLKPPDEYAILVAHHGVAVQAFRNYVSTVLRPHQINMLVMSFIVRGEARHVITDAEFMAGVGSVGITRYGESHDILTDQEGIDLYNIYLDPRQFPVPQAPYELRHVQQVLFPESDRFRHLLNRSMHFQFDDPAQLLHIVRGIERETLNPQAGSDEMVRSLFQLLIIACCRAARDSGVEPVIPGKQSVPRWTLDLCRYLDESYFNPISLDDLCLQSGLTRSYLCRTFKKNVGLTTGEYLTHRRIEAAMQALRSSDEKILTIALDCGFRDLSNFNRSFKVRTGMAPSEYRKNGGTTPNFGCRD